MGKVFGLASRGANDELLVARDKMTAGDINL